MGDDDADVALLLSIDWAETLATSERVELLPCRLFLAEPEDIKDFLRLCPLFSSFGSYYICICIRDTHSSQAVRHRL